MRTTILDVDLATCPEAIEGLGSHEHLLAMIRWRGRPLGQVRLPIRDGRLAGTVLRGAATTALGPVLAGGERS